MGFSVLVDEYLQRFGLKRRVLLGRLRDFVVREIPLPITNRLDEILEEGRLQYIHDSTVICEIGVQEDVDRVFLRFADDKVLKKHMQELEGLDVIGNNIIVERFEQLDQETIKTILQETIEERRGHWLEKLQSRKGRTRALCFGNTDLDVFELLDHILNHYLGFQVLGPVRGNEGLELVHQEKPDVVFLDIYRFSSEAWTLLDQMKNDTSISSVPVIAVLVRSVVPGTPLRLSGPLPDAVLHKPFLPVDVGRALCHALDVGGEWRRLKELAFEQTAR